MTTVLKEYRPILLVVAFGFLGSAFYITYRPRRRVSGQAEAPGAPAARRGGLRLNMMKLNKIILWAAAVFLVFFLFFPQAFTSLFAAGDSLSADMEQTVIKIEGMT